VYLSSDITKSKGARHRRWWYEVTPTQLRRIRTRLTAFAEDLFQSIPRKDQRRWGQSYLRGLLLDGKRKSIQPMAARLARGAPTRTPTRWSRRCSSSSTSHPGTRRRCAAASPSA
jgi:SRSO17 transposase